MTVSLYLCQKVAKVTGAKLNKMGMQTALGKLDGADMIVIGASELEDGVLEDCVQAVRKVPIPW